MLFDEFGRGGDEAVQLDDALDAAEIAAERSLRLGENVDGAEFGGTLAGGNVDILAEMAGDGDLAVFHRQLAGNIEKIAADDIGNIVGSRRGGLRQGYPQFLQAGLDLRRTFSSPRFCCQIFKNMHQD